MKNEELQKLLQGFPHDIEICDSTWHIIRGAEIKGLPYPEVLQLTLEENASDEV